MTHRRQVQEIIRLIMAQMWYWEEKYITSVQKDEGDRTEQNEQE